MRWDESLKGRLLYNGERVGGGRKGRAREGRKWALLLAYAGTGARGLGRKRGEGETRRAGEGRHARWVSFPWVWVEVVSTAELYLVREGVLVLGSAEGNNSQAWE